MISRIIAILALSFINCDASVRTLKNTGFLHFFSKVGVRNVPSSVRRTPSLNLHTINKMSVRQLISLSVVPAAITGVYLGSFYDRDEYTFKTSVGRAIIALVDNDTHYVQETLQGKYGKRIIQERGQLLLYRALDKNNVEIIKFLIAAGVDVNRVSEKEGMPPLRYAVSHSSPEVVEFLIQQGAATRYTDNDSKGLLHHASQEGRADVVKLLIDQGVQINSIDKEGNTPLHYAVRRGDVASVEHLLQVKDIKIFDCNNVGVRPVDYIEEENMKRVFEKYDLYRIKEIKKISLKDIKNGTQELTDSEISTLNEMFFRMLDQESSLKDDDPSSFLKIVTPHCILYLYENTEEMILYKEHTVRISIEKLAEYLDAIKFFFPQGKKYFSPTPKYLTYEAASAFGNTRDKTKTWSQDVVDFLKSKNVHEVILEMTTPETGYSVTYFGNWKEESWRSTCITRTDVDKLKVTPIKRIKESYVGPLV